jgi:subtilase family serine protease
MTIRIRTGWLPSLAILLALTLMGSAFAASGRTLANHTPGFVATAQNLGPEDPNRVITVTLMLEQRNVAQRDALLKALYTKGNPLYHQWLTAEQYAAQFGATSQDAAVVRDFLISKGLNVQATDQYNAFVRAQGTVADVQRAFNVQLHRFNVNGKTVMSNTGNPSIEGAAGYVVKSVLGLHDTALQPFIKYPVDPDTGQPYPAVPLEAGTDGLFFEGQCWRGVQTQAFTTGGKMPAAVYAGNRYGADPGGSAPHIAPCGYSPAELQTAYGMTAVYNQGWKGQGQTIVIVDAFGSPTAAADLAVFSAEYQLPAPSFQVICPDSRGCPTGNLSWAGEVTLDIEWSHAMAPAAGVVLEVGYTNNDPDLLLAVYDAINNHRGNVISNSYGEEEAYPAPGDFDAATLNAWNDAAAAGAAQGIAVNFSSGDSGDYFAADGYTTVSSPADAPYATGVGGTSVFLNPDDSIKFQTGWGTSITRLAQGTAGNPPVIPPLHSGFQYGAGGGTSAFYAKPSYQSGLQLTGRGVPDIAHVADPYTGVEIIYSYSSPGTYHVTAIGGTSVACPVFSGIWAITNQAAGVALGQAAPYVYHMPAGAITDIQQVGSPTNVAGSTFSGGPPTYYSPAALASPLGPNTTFVSALYHSPSSARWYDLVFGNDSSLTTGPGWDNVTGMGTPNGMAFINGVLSQLP